MEKTECRKDAQLAYSLDIALPNKDCPDYSQRRPSSVPRFPVAATHFKEISHHVIDDIEKEHNTW